MSGNAGQGEVALPYYATMGSCIKRARFGFDETYPAWHTVLVERFYFGPVAFACALT
jgi:hypothetical protein